MKKALKEWGTTIEALGKGKVIALWKKSGMTEFEIKESQFVLFPTYTPQSMDKIKKNYWDLYNQNSKLNKDNQVKVKYWAEIVQIIEIKSFEELKLLSPVLINSEENLIFSWNQPPFRKGKVLLLRVFELTNHILITNRPEFAYCKHWIKLKVDIPRAGSKKPVMKFWELNNMVDHINNLLQPFIPPLPFPETEDELKEASMVEL